MTETPDPNVNPLHHEQKLVMDWQNMGRGCVVVFGLISAALSVVGVFVDWNWIDAGSTFALIFAASMFALLVLHGFIVATAVNIALRRTTISTAVTGVYLREIEQAMGAGKPLDEIALSTVAAQGPEGERTVAFIHDYMSKLRSQGNDQGDAS